MAKKQRKFADDGWAVWIDGDDTSTVYINDWLNPKGKSYVDMAIRIRGMKSSRRLCVYVPFSISANEIEDVSLHFHDVKILQAIFSSTCIVDYKKNEHTSEIAYNGKTVDIMGENMANNKLLSAVITVLIVYVLSSCAQWILTVCTNSISFGVSKNIVLFFICVSQFLDFIA